MCIVVLYFSQHCLEDLAPPGTGHVSQIFSLQTSILAIFRCPSLRFMPEFAIILIQTFGNPGFMPIGPTLKAVGWNCLSSYSDDPPHIYFPGLLSSQGSFCPLTDGPPSVRLFTYGNRFSLLTFTSFSFPSRSRPLFQGCTWTSNRKQLLSCLKCSGLSRRIYSSCQYSISTPPHRVRHIDLMSTPGSTGLALSRIFRRTSWKDLPSRLR